MEHHRYACSYCNKSYSQRAKLTFHEKVQHGPNNNGGIKCTFCDLMFSTHASRHRHERNIHLGEKMYVCGMCTMQFNTKYSLEGHIRSKHGERLKCEKCGSSFVFRHSLKEHRQRCDVQFTRDPMRAESFRCTDCNSEFTTKRALKVHNDSKHKGNTYLCEVCAKEFNYHSSYSRHKKLKHQM
jgi:KRAB domain-containing zinc finger protein